MNIDYEKLAKERFTGTKIQNFHQITAVSQGAINLQMKAVHALTPKDHPLKHLLTDTVPEDQWTQVDAVLGPPKIELLFETEYRVVLYTMSLESGTYKYWIGQGPQAKKAQKPINKWTLVFKVNLDLKALEKNQDVPQYVKDTLKKLDDYSIRQLLVDLNTADILNFQEKLSVIDLESPYLKNGFALCLQNYIVSLKHEDKRDHSIIHYVPSSKKPDAYPIPTLPPTDLNFQNLEFVVSDLGTGEKDDNMLIYVQMTNNEKLPIEPLGKSANWVVPVPPGKAGYDGTVALSKKIFLEDWLLKKLEPLNRATSFVVDDVLMDDDLPSPIPVWYCKKMSFHAGFNAGEEPSKGPWTYNSKDSSDTVNVYNYEYFNRKGDDSGPPWVYCSMQHTTKNTVKIPVGLNNNGKCVIEISGSTRTEANIHTGYGEWSPERTASWSAEITLDGVDHGKLQIKTKLTHDFKGDSADDEDKYPDATKILKGTTAKIKEVLDKLNTGDVEKDMKEALEGSWAFVFAGAADFIFNEAAFNKEGDLLAKLKYNTHT